jgi:hypothetical protein
MNNLKSTIFASILSLYGFAQSSTSCNSVSDDFNTPGLWSHPILGSNLQSPANYSTIGIGGGFMNFGQSNDNDMNYVYRSGLTVNNSNFRAEIDFTHTSNGETAGGAGHVVLGICSDNEPFFNSTTSVGGSPLSPSPLTLTPSIHDGIAVTFESNEEFASTDFFFQVYLMDDGILSSVGMPTLVSGPLPAGTISNYYLQLIRVGTTSGLLNVYADPARTFLINSSGLFTIPSSISDLNTVQFGTNEWQEANRMLTGKLDNLCVDNFTNTSTTGTCTSLYDDFNSPYFWAHPVLSPTLSCNALVTMNINSGTFNFLQSRDNNFNFMNRSGFLVDDLAFKAEIDFTHTSNGSLPANGVGGAGHTLLALNSGELPFFSNPSLSPGLPGAPCSDLPLSLFNSFQKGIAVTFESDLPEDPTDFAFKVYVNDGSGVFPAMAGVPISVGPAPSGGTNTSYYIRLERLSATSGMFSVFSDAARTVLIGSSAFTLPASINGLNTVQIGGNEWQEEKRMLTGTLDNLCIQNTSQSTAFIEDKTVGSFTIYPNPANETLNIETIDLIENLAVFNLNGSCLLKSSPNTLKTSIGLNDLQSGVYLIQIGTTNGYHFQRFIKN